MLNALQADVQTSKTDHQRQTNFEQRTIFLGTEVGEVQKEALKLLGAYGAEARDTAKDRLAQELCDLIWNACDLATMAGIELDESMRALLEKNKSRVRTPRVDPIGHNG